VPVDIFAKIGDIKGEARDDRHRDEIEVLSWAWGLSQSVSASPGGGGGTGKAAFSDLSFVHVFDKASPNLMKACATGEHISEATLTARKAGQGQQDYLVIKMADVIITNVAPSGGGDEARVIEAVSMRFGKVDLEYRAQKPDGSFEVPTRFAFDIRANRIG
jgi:type VI secretion system secreted protein Hcp